MTREILQLFTMHYVSGAGAYQVETYVIPFRCRVIEIVLNGQSDAVAVAWMQVNTMGSPVIQATASLTESRTFGMLAGLRIYTQAAMAVHPMQILNRGQNLNFITYTNNPGINSIFTAILEKF